MKKKKGKEHIPRTGMEKYTPVHYKFSHIKS